MVLSFIEKDINNLRHCDYGPAVIREIGNEFHKEWWIHGKRHRADGPAIEYADGAKHWFYNDELIDCGSQQEFDKYIKMKAFW